MCVCIPIVGIVGLVVEDVTAVTAVGVTLLLLLLLELLPSRVQILSSLADDMYCASELTREGGSNGRLVEERINENGESNN